MTTLTRPSWFKPRECMLALRKSGLQFTSPFNGTTQAIETLAERWVCNLNLPGAADGGPLQALLARWSGGVNAMPLFHFGRPQPLGTLRGAPTLGTATARGDVELDLAGCTNRNLLHHGSFELDGNADGLADGWTAFVGGAGDGARTLTKARVTYDYNVIHGSYAQYIEISAAGNANDTGIVAARVAVLPSTTYTLSAYMFCSTASKQYLLGRQFKADNTTQTGSDATTAYASTSVMERKSTTFTTQADAAFLEIAVRGITAVGQSMRIDAVQLEVGAAATDFAGYPTLLAGDMIGDGTQLYQVADDCEATDAGAMTVPVVNRARGVVASGTLVLWDRPTALFLLPAMESAPVWRRGGIDGVALDAVEVWY